jgi:thiamine biosynthesis lipoprotein
MKTAALVLCLGIGVSARPAEGVTRARYLMGTICEIDAADGAEIDAAFDEGARVERLISTWRDDTELARLNHREITQVSPELYALLRDATAIARNTGGAFNPLVRPLIDLWHTRGEGRVPNEAARKDAIARVALANARFCGPRTIVSGTSNDSIQEERFPKRDRVDGQDCPSPTGYQGPSSTEYQGPSSTILLLNNAQFEEGGFGKGYALGKMLAKLTGPHAVLNFGGQLLVRGSERVTIAHPLHRDRPVVALTLTNASLSTSSGSEKAFLVDGVRFSHILDPATGMALPPRGSVSVIDASPLTADALSTALYVMGPERGLAWARAHHVTAIFISETGEMTTSSPIDGLTMVKEKP